MNSEQDLLVITCEYLRLIRTICCLLVLCLKGLIFFSGAFLVCVVNHRQAVSKTTLWYIVCISGFLGVVSRTGFDCSSHRFLIQNLLHNMSNCSGWSLSPAVAGLFFYLNTFSEFSLLLIWGFDFQIIKDLPLYFWFVSGQYLTYFSVTFFPSEHKATFPLWCRA